jgi:hypothetical protein
VPFGSQTFFGDTAGQSAALKLSQFIPLIHVVFIPYQLPNMGPFPGPNSVLIMDNARIHIGGWMQELCNA